MNEFGNFLKELRGKKSLRDVQKDIGISHTYLSTLEKGFDPRTKKPRKPTLETLKKLSDHYDVDYSVLMEKAGYINKQTLDIMKINEKISASIGNLAGVIDDFLKIPDLSKMMQEDLRWGSEILSVDEKQLIANFIYGVVSDRPKSKPIKIDSNGNKEE